MIYKCTNCKYEGHESIEDKFCPVCGDYVESINVSKQEETVKDYKVEMVIPNKKSISNKKK